MRTSPRRFKKYIAEAATNVYPIRQVELQVRSSVLSQEEVNKRTGCGSGRRSRAGLERLAGDLLHGSSAETSAMEDPCEQRDQMEIKWKVLGIICQFYLFESLIEELEIRGHGLNLRMSNGPIRAQLFSPLYYSPGKKTNSKIYIFFLWAKFGTAW